VQVSGLRPFAGVDPATLEELLDDELEADEQLALEPGARRSGPEWA
jgi:hypothetical protein